MSYADGGMPYAGGISFNALRGQAKCTMRAAPNLLLGQKIWTKRALAAAKPLSRS